MSSLEPVYGYWAEFLKTFNLISAIYTQKDFNQYLSSLELSFKKKLNVKSAVFLIKSYLLNQFFCHCAVFL